MKATATRPPPSAASVRDYAIYTLSPEGLVSGWNPGAEAIIGYSADEVIGTNFSRFFTEEDRASGKPQNLLQTASTSPWAEQDGWRVRKDGSRFEVHVTLTALRNRQAVLLGFAIILHDLTARRASEAEQAQLTSLLRLAHEAVLVRDLNDRITFWNGGAEALYQWTEEEVFGRVSHELLKTDFPIPLPEIEASIRQNATWEGRLTHHRKDGPW